MASWQRQGGFGLLAVLIALSGCNGGGSTETGRDPGDKSITELQVHVVNYPLQYFAERIGGRHVQVQFPAPADVDPAFWRPSAEDVAGYQNADLVLLNGAGYAKWLNGVSLPTASLVDTSAGFRDRYVAIEDLETHSHGPQGEHEHGRVAFTTWLDLRLAVEQARAIEVAFRAALPDGAETFRSGREALEQDLLDLDRELRKIVEGRDRSLMGSHPVYQYLAQGYGLEIESVHFEPDEFPEDARWRALGDQLERRPARWMLWEGSPLERTEQRLQELGLGSVVFDPCGNRPGEGDLLFVQRANVENLRKIYEAGP